MYGYEWTEENGIFRLTINAKIQKEIRPVFHEELDFFGMDQYWDYPKDTTAPLLWAEGVRRYVLNGVCVAEAQGGGFYTKPTIKRLTEERLKLVPIDTDRLYEVNRQIMLSLEQKAVQFIQTQYEHYLPLGFSFVCAFSGGKDSLVLLDLMTKALAPKDYYVVFSNTGMELSDTLKTFVDAQKHWPGVRFKEAKCHMDMEESWNEFGPPASKLRWCCSVRKSVPTLMLLSELTGKDTKAVVFDGVRAEESLRRSKYTEVGEGVKNIQQVNCHAILKWSSAEIFVYALKKNVLLNNAYRHGIYRVGCKVCPMSAKWQDSLISFNYPDEVKSQLRMLEDMTLFAKGKIDKKYIEDGGWQARAGGKILKQGENRVSEEITATSIVFRIKNARQNWNSVLPIWGIPVDDDGKRITVKTKHGKGATTQMQSVLNSISPEILQFTEIDGIANATGDKTVTAVSALAKVIRDKMDSGQRVILSDLWRELQEPPFGYYNTIACGILLGLIFSCYKNTAFSWTDSVQSTHILNEQTLKSMILSMCKGSLNSDYLSAGSITFQHFRDYVKDIINLTDAQVATEAECCRNMRAAITQSGAPFWALKYLPDGTYGPNTDKANTIINEMQQFISADIDREAIMNDVLLNFQSRGKVKVAMRKAFQDKAVMSTAFRNFLYSSSPALADVATTLSIQPVDLSDRLHLSMQGEIYTWTEQQVADKLADIVNEYQYLVEVDHALGQNYRNLEDARKDLANRFKYQRIPFTAVEDIQKPWYPALKALRTLSLGKVAHLTADERNADAAALRSYGKSANDFLTDSKPTLADILDDRDVNCTAEELDAIYSGLKSTPFDATLTQFNHLLDQQVARIGQARNRSKLKALWESVTGKESVKAWCDSFSTPIFWIIPKELRKPIHTVIDLQSGITTPRDTEVIAAIDALQNEKARVLTDAQKVYAALYETIGSEYVTYFKVHRPELLAKLKLSHGNDMSTWEAPELSRLQSMMKSAIQQQARQEKLQNTKNEIAEMPVSRLRENIASFLDSHPEYCDEFLK